MKILGYLTMYIRVESEELEPSYFTIKSDFRKPITRKIMRRLLKGAKETAISMGLTPTKICFTSEEEFKNSGTETAWVDEWHEEEED